MESYYHFPSQLSEVRKKRLFVCEIKSNNLKIWNYQAKDHKAKVKNKIFIRKTRASHFLADEWCWVSFHIFVKHMTPLYVFFCKRPVQIFCLFANWIVSFISIELQSFLYMLETSFYFFLSNTHLSIFSPSLWPAFSFSFLISMRFNLSFIFLFYFGIISKKSLLYPTS